MKTKFRHGLVLTVLAVVFTIGLTFASVELPRIVDAFLRERINFLDVATGLDEVAAYKTELYLQHYHLRLIGYVCLALIISLIILGFITNRSGLSSAGAIFLFLPAFGHFAMTMFFLGGLGFLHLLWMPFWEVSDHILHLGDFVCLPYRILLYTASLLALDVWDELALVITGLGLLLFTLGTLAWFHAKIQKKPIADFWVYRLSRHPQYLGWITWSYGVMFLPGPNIKKMFDFSNSLAWLLATMVIIGVAMLEELDMRRRNREAYESYCRRTPFLLPVPRVISRIISAPMRWILGKDHPQKKREIAGVLALYTAICVLLSMGYVHLPSWSKIKGQVAPTGVNQDPDELVRTFKAAPRRSADQYAVALAALGEPGVERLVELLQDQTPHIREFSAMALGDAHAQPAVALLIPLLQDEEWRVRQAARSALIGIQPDSALQYLASAMSNEPLAVRYHAAQELGKIGTAQATQALIVHLDDEHELVRMVIINALGSIGSEAVVVPLIAALQDENEKVRRASALALSRTKPEEAVVPLIAALKDEDWEVRLYATEALKAIGTSAALEALRSH